MLLYELGPFLAWLFIDRVSGPVSITGARKQKLGLSLQAQPGSSGPNLDHPDSGVESSRVELDDCMQARIRRQSSGVSAAAADLRSASAAV